MASIQARVDNNKSIDAQRIQFLWDSYKPEFWYFEFIECSRRLMLTAVLSVLVRFPGYQTVAAILISQFYLAVYIGYCPYDDPNDDIIATVAEYQIFFTF